MARLYPSHSIDQLLQSGLRQSSMYSRQLYSRRFGEPSRQEIHVLRRQRGDVLLLSEDFEGTEHLLPMDRTSLALAHAQARVHPLVPTDRDPDDILANGRRLLRGDAEDRAGI